MKLKPSQRGYHFEIRGRVEMDGRIGWELHAQAHLALRPLAAPPAQNVDGLEARMTGKALEPNPRGIETPQEKFLRFGPRWRVLQSGRFGDDEAIGRLSLPSGYAKEVEDFGLHPALLDIATGWAMELIEGYEAETLWVPISYERVRVYEDLPAEVVSWVRNAQENRADADFAFFDVT